ncbi:MAG: acyl-CoA dehydrogenase family protein [Eisenbergiella sp.]
MLYQTTQEHEAFRQKMRGFAESEVKPIAFMLDQNNEFPAEAVKKLGEMGLMGIPYPKEYGGAGLDVLSYAIAVEELSRVDGGTGVILSAHVSLGSWPIFAFGTKAEKEISDSSGKGRKNRRFRPHGTQRRLGCGRYGNNCGTER